jgi:hypothetical protein
MYAGIVGAIVACAFRETTGHNVDSMGLRDFSTRFQYRSTSRQIFQPRLAVTVGADVRESFRKEHHLSTGIRSCI